MKEEKEPKQDDAKSPTPIKDVRPLAEKIGFAKLDLRVEEVEERIRPRETNVFDK
jgi:hypothetical protein